MTAFAVSKAFRPVYWPFSSAPPIMLEIVAAWIASSSSPSPSATRTTTVTGLHWSPMAASAGAKVPLVPALPAAATTSVINTGTLSGNIFSSASEAVQTMPIMAVETVEMTRVPSLISSTCTPCLKSGIVFDSVRKLQGYCVVRGREQRAMADVRAVKQQAKKSPQTRARNHGVYQAGIGGQSISGARAISARLSNTR